VFKLKNSNLRPYRESFDLVELSPVLTLKRNILISNLEARLNLMPLLSSYKLSIYAGEIASKTSESEENWITTSQFVPGLKASVGFNYRGKGPLGLILEGGLACFSDNQKITAEKTNAYFFSQIGITYSLFYNKRFYLTHE
jgi:hypothetical protein